MLVFIKNQDDKICTNRLKQLEHEEKNVEFLGSTY